MSTPSLATEICYPESDGQPMAESELHQDWMIRIMDILRQRYLGEQVYVAGNMFLYYVEGSPEASVAPDVFVVRGINPIRRKSYKLWVEKQPPNVVFETTSAATSNTDLEVKPEIYASIGVAEYFLYDPSAEYLKPSLQGRRLTRSGYISIRPNLEGRLESQQLDITLELDGVDLVLRDRQTGEVLETGAEIAKREAAKNRREALRQRAAKQAAKREAEARRKEAERERAAKEAAERESEARRREAERERAAKEAAERESEARRQEAERERAAKKLERAAKEAAERESEARRQEAERERAAKEAAEQAVAALSRKTRELEQALARQGVARPAPPPDQDRKTP